MRRVFVVAVFSTLSMGPAMADGGLGGGLIEFLVTGSNARPASTPAPAPAAVEPSQNFGGAYISSAGGMPRIIMATPAPEPQRMASLAPPEPTVVHAEIPPQFLRQEVAYDGPERPGVIVIDTPERFLFLVEPDGRAMRYGIGVGRPGFEWAGVKVISRKAEWPDWTPPSQMMLRRPDLPAHMAGGPENPLGARAMYLGSSLYRIHGTNEPWSIGQNVSSGCIRMMNDDVIDLYGRVGVGTKVIVM